LIEVNGQCVDGEIALEHVCFQAAAHQPDEIQPELIGPSGMPDDARGLALVIQGEPPRPQSAAQGSGQFQ
jgi:hypothetical protein